MDNLAPRVKNGQTASCFFLPGSSSQRSSHSSSPRLCALPGSSSINFSPTDYILTIKSNNPELQGAFPCAPGDEVCALDYKTSGCSGRRKRSAHGDGAHPGAHAHPQLHAHPMAGAHPEAGAHPNTFAHHAAQQPNQAHPQPAAFPGNAF